MAKYVSMYGCLLMASERTIWNIDLDKAMICLEFAVCEQDKAMTGAFYMKSRDSRDILVL